MMTEVKDYCAIDLETTGLHPKEDKIIQIGAVKVRDYKIVDEMEIFVNPKQLLERKIMDLTHISQEEVDGGCTQEEGFSILRDFIGDDILVGHQLIFDYSFLKQVAVNMGISFEKKGIDTLKISRSCLKNLEKKNLSYVARYYELPLTNHHRALCDAKASALILLKLQEEFIEKSPKEFQPFDLQYHPKKQQKATVAQLRDLKRYKKEYPEILPVNVEEITRSQASRLLQEFIKTYGKIKRT